MQLKYIKQSELKAFRKKQYDAQKGVCPILKKKIAFKDSVLDHIHKKKKGDQPGIDDGGLLRGVINRRANAAEGVFLNAYKRKGLEELISFPDFLRNLADYVENKPLADLGIVHPTEVIREKKIKLGIRRYNKIKKHWKDIHPKKKMPAFSDKLFLTKAWQDDLDKAIKINSEKFK